MEVKIEVAGCPYEDGDQLKHYINALDYAAVIGEAREIIRSRLKWGEGVTPEEERTLEEIRDCLSHQDLD